MRVRIGFARFRIGTVMDACNALINGGLLGIWQTLIMRWYFHLLSVSQYSSLATD